MSFRRAYYRNQRYKKMYENNISTIWYDDVKCYYAKGHTKIRSSDKRRRNKTIRLYAKHLAPCDSCLQHGGYHKIPYSYWW